MQLEKILDQQKKLVAGVLAMEAQGRRQFVILASSIYRAAPALRWSWTWQIIIRCPKMVNLTLYRNLPY